MSTMAFTTTQNRDEIKRALEGTGLRIDKAFFIAAQRCGIDPMELVPRTKKSFRKQTEKNPDDKVLEIRQQGYEQSRQNKMDKIIEEQENVRIMLKKKVDPTLVPIKQPWIVAGPGEGNQKAAAEHSAAELVQIMIEQQEKREREMKEAEKEAVAAALRRQARDIEHMVAGEKASALRASIAAEKTRKKEEERMEEEKLRLKRKKEAAEKEARAMEKRRLELEEDQKRLTETMKREAEEAAEEKKRMIIEEKKAEQRRLEAAKAADLAVEMRRQKTEAVFKEIDRQADENMRILEERAKVVAKRQAEAAAIVAEKNAAKQKASEERIAAVLEAQRQKQLQKRIDYENHLAATEARRLERKEEEEKELLQHSRKLAEQAKRRDQAYEQAQERNQQRIEAIKKHSEEKGKVFNRLQEAREVAHGHTMARNEVQQQQIRDNVERYMRINEMKRQQGLMKIIEEDKRVLMIKKSKEELLKQRNIAAHQAVVRKQLIRDKLGEMKSTQNFKGLKKLSSLVGLEDTPSDIAGDTTGKLDVAEPSSPVAM